ncbi:MAG: ABC transporter ATP-binding protein [Thermoanaerobaculia bacterium]
MPTSTRRHTEEVVVSLQGLRKAFGAKEVLRGLSLEVHRGESVVMVGGSGTGKSVTLRHIIGLIRPDRGRVLIEGQDIGALNGKELNAIRRKFGMSFQEGALFDSMSVFENIAFPLRRHTRMTEGEIRDRVFECLEMVHLSGVDGKRPSELSGGMRRRVGFARAISLSPEILLFDEPTTGLDPVISDVVADLIVEMDEKLGATAITITHDMKVAFKIADKIAMIYGGRIIEEGTPEEFERSSDPCVRQFLEGRAEGPLTEEAQAAESATASARM